jgi:hypothetical protein
MSDFEQHVRDSGADTYNQLAGLVRRVDHIAELLAVQTDRLLRSTVDLAAMHDEIKAAHDEITEIRDYANRWKGAFYAITGLGGVLAAATAFWDHIRTLWGSH